MDPHAALPCRAKPSLVQGFILLLALLGNAMCFRKGTPPPRLRVESADSGGLREGEHPPGAWGKGFLVHG